MSKRFTSLILAAFGIAAMFTMATSAAAAPASSNVPTAPSVEVPAGSGGVSAAADAVCYQVWMANVGSWQPNPAACNDQGAGTEGESRAIEALWVQSYRGGLCLKAHVQDLGDDQHWSCEGPNGVAVGTQGLSKRLEGVHIHSGGLRVCATAYVQDLGWQLPERCGQEIWVGTSGQGKRMEKIRIHFES